MTEHEQDLARLVTDGLDRQVRGLDRAPLDLGAVQHRARSVRRRRRAVAVGAAALVAAVVVPVALSLGGDAGPSRGDRGIDPAGDPTLAVDAAQPLAFMQGTVVTLGDGRTVETGLPPQAVQQLAVLDDDRVVLAVTGPTDGDGSSVVVVGSDGEEQARYPVGTTLSLRTSPDRSLVAWIDGDDRPQVLEAGVTEPTALAPLTDDRETNALVVGVGGSDCADDGCRVWAVTGETVNVVGDADGVQEVDLPAGLVLSDVHAPDGDVEQMAASEQSRGGEQQPCAVLLEPDGTRRARTCATAFLRFSPDGTRLQGATYENDTTSTVTVVDTDLGVLATIRPAGSTISRIAWEDDESLLAAELTYAGSRTTWSLVRYPVSDPGTPEVVVGPVRGPDFPPLLRVPD